MLVTAAERLVELLAELLDFREATGELDTFFGGFGLHVR